VEPKAKTPKVKRVSVCFIILCRYFTEMKWRIAELFI